MEANAAERKRWNDERWVAVWPKREALTDQITPYLLDTLSLQPGERVVDVGSGGGKATIAAARAVAPTGSATGADVSAGLTRLAAQRASDAHVDNVSFCVADVQTDSIAGAPFGVAMSQFGVMFFDEPLTAFTKIREQLAPGGRIAFSCWQTVDRNPWFVGAALAGMVPPPPPPAPGKSPTGPFALGDHERTQGILERAGFTDVQRTAKELLAEVPQDSLVDESQLAFMGVPAEKMAEAKAAVNRHLGQFESGPGQVKFPLSYQIFQACVR